MKLPSTPERRILDYLIGSEEEQREETSRLAGIELVELREWENFEEGATVCYHFVFRS